MAKTRHLSLIEDLAYRRLLDAYYTSEGPLPHLPQDCARLVAMREHSGEVESVLNEFFTHTERGWENCRCEEEIGKYRKLADSARKANTSRWEKRRSDSTSEIRSETRSGSDLERNAIQTATKKQEPRTNQPPTPEGDFGFDEFWSAYPRKDARANALKSWTKLTPDAELRAKIIAHVASRSQTKDWTKEGGAFVPHAATFINQRRWEDAVKSSDDDFWSNVEPWA